MNESETPKRRRPKHEDVYDRIEELEKELDNTKKQFANKIAELTLYAKGLSDRIYQLELRNHFK